MERRKYGEVRGGFVGRIAQKHDRIQKVKEINGGNSKFRPLFAFVTVMLVLIGLGLSLAISPPTENSESPASVTYNVRGPIAIVGDIGFTAGNGVNGGTGTSGDPYIIDDWDITAAAGHAISITGTRAYFQIRNCSLHDGRTPTWDGIILTNVENGTITNNSILNNTHGIHLDSSDWNNILNNTVSINSLDGIYLDGSFNNSIENNTCMTNGWNGVFLSVSDDNFVFNNTCNSNLWDGIYLEASSDNKIKWNNCSKNVDDGIEMFWKCNGNVVFQNVVISNTDYGCSISTSCAGNTVNQNTFIFNRGSLAYPAYNPLMVQGYDNNGPVNSWSQGGQGNYWYDWTGPDILPGPPDLIVDNPYLLDGGAGVTDPSPLVNFYVIPEPGTLVLAISMLAICLASIRWKRG
jgi:parallel beta-helix repeat protein